MQVGMGAFAGGHGGRNLRFTALVVAFVVLVAWLWTRIVIAVVNGATLPRLELLLTAIASIATLVVVVSLWRNPISRNVQLMTTPALRQALATHHAGHVVAAHLADPSRLRRIELGQACTGLRSEVPAITHTALRTELGIEIAGLTAEELFSGESGSHAASDLKRATEIGADMVGRYGMTGSLVSFAATRSRRPRFVTRVLDDARTRKDLESLLREVKRETTRSLLENRHLVVTVRDALMRNNRLDARQIRAILANAERTRREDDEVLVDLRVVGSRPASGQ